LANMLAILGQTFECDVGLNHVRQVPLCGSRLAVYRAAISSAVEFGMLARRFRFGSRARANAPVS